MSSPSRALWRPFAKTHAPTYAMRDGAMRKPFVDSGAAFLKGLMLVQ